MVFSNVGGSGAVGDRLDLLELVGHSFFIGRREVLVLDLVERRVVEIE